MTRDGLIELLGDELAAKLMQTYGGQQIYCPQQMRPCHPFSKQFGEHAAMRLSRSLGGLHFHVPKFVQDDITARNEAIRAAARGGLGLSALARAFKLSSRQVTSILHATTPKG